MWFIGSASLCAGQMFVQLQVNWIGAPMQVELAWLKAKMDLLINVIPPSERERGWEGRTASFVGRTSLCWVLLKLLPGFKSKLRFSVSQELRFWEVMRYCEAYKSLKVCTTSLADILSASHLLFPCKTLPLFTVPVRVACSATVLL